MAVKAKKRRQQRSFLKFHFPKITLMFSREFCYVLESGV
jgi:hypothetical protein